MDTVTNIASAASKAIFGEDTTATNETGGTEPVSGQTGNVEAGEPYDKGNTEPLSTDAEPKSETTAVTSNPEPTDTTAPAEYEPNKISSSAAPTTSTAPFMTEPSTSSPSTTKEVKEKATNLGEAGAGVGTGGGGVAKEALKDEVTSKNINSTAGEGVGVAEAGQKSGGDFEAENKKAEQEGGRILGEKGIEPQASSSSTSKADAYAEGKADGNKTPEGKEKKSFKEKFKAKLHKN